MKVLLKKKDILSLMKQNSLKIPSDVFNAMATTFV